MRFLLLLAVALQLRAGDHDFGPVPPVLIPDLPALRQDGTPVSLHQIFSGRRTAVQLIFVDCPTACPLLGSLFRRVDQSNQDPKVQLVTITVNPQADTPPRLTTWLRTLHASPRWLALQLTPQNLATLLRSLGQKPGALTSHTLQIFHIDERSRYVARTTELPTAQAVLATLQPVSRRTPQAPATTLPHSGQALYSTPLVATVGQEALAATCANCHGAKRTGTAEGAPALLTLTTAQSRRGGPPSLYTEAAFCHALKTGTDPAGVQFSALMPRYDLDPKSCDQLWQFLTVRKP